MWDFDAEGIVVDVIFTKGGHSMYTEVRVYYELQCISQGMYGIRRHAISDALEYRSTDYLIPTSLAYLQRAGTLEDYEKDITYYYADFEDTRLRNIDKFVALRNYIHLVFGEWVYTDTQESLDALIPRTKLKVGSFLDDVHEAVISMKDLKAQSGVKISE